MVRKPRQGDNLLLNTVPQFGHEQTGKLLLDQLTTIDYESQSVYFLERVHESLVEKLFVKVITVFQKVSQ